MLRVVVLTILLPFWLTSEIRNAGGWHIVTKSSVIALVWMTTLVVVAVATSPPPVEQQTRTEAPEAIAPSPTPEPTRTEEPTPTPNDDPPSTPELVAEGSGSALPSLAAALDRLERLDVRAEGPRSGYDRDLFRLWIDADGDGRDTRREVLMEESLTAVASCALSGGRWRSAYDGAETTDASNFDIDHFVPLAEAWDSGASSWASSRRDAFANDLGYAGSLIAVTASSNRSKSDRDPAEWKPSLQSYWCSYSATWVEVKLRWQLTAHAAEFDTLRSMLGSCGSVQPAAAPVPPVAPQPTVKATSKPTQQPGGGSCHPSYPNFCIAPPPPDLNCPDVGRKNFTVRHDVADPDPHRFDIDKDGIGCES